MGRFTDPRTDRGCARGTARRARPRGALSHRAPRPQAGEPARHRSGPGQGRGLRHREGVEHEHERLPDEGGHDGGDADVHGSRAGDGAGARSLHRPLLGRRHGLRAARRARPVPRHRHAGGDHPAPRQRGHPARAHGQPGDRPGAVGLDRAVARQGAGAADAECGAGLGRARGGRTAAAGIALEARGAAAGKLRAAHSAAADTRSVHVDGDRDAGSPDPGCPAARCTGCRAAERRGRDAGVPDLRQARARP